MAASCTIATSCARPRCSSVHDRSRPCRPSAAGSQTRSRSIEVSTSAREKGLWIELTVVWNRPPTANLEVVQDFKICADLNPYTAMRTLILDDEEPIVTLLGRICSGEGHEVSTFTSSTQALGFLASEPVDLLITDMNMPG